MKKMISGVIVLLSAISAQAQPLTLNSPCGAPGVGLNVDRAIDVHKIGTPGVHVDADGGWTTCKMPAPPKDCPAPPTTWTEGKHTCIALSAPSQVRSGAVVLLRQQAGEMRGYTALQCTDGAWSTRLTTCAPNTQCLLRGYMIREDSRVYGFADSAKPAAIGEVVVATAPDGSTLRRVCNPDGTLGWTPEALPPPAPAASVAAVTCGPAKVPNINVGASTPVELAYDGPAVPADGTAVFKRTDGGAPGHYMRCTREGRWSYVGRAPFTAPSGPSIWDKK